MVNSIWVKAKETAVENDSVVDFPTKTRLHIALNVKNVNKISGFYNTLFGQEPHTIRDGYIKYDVKEPPLNISLNEVPKNAKGNGIFGIQAKDDKHLNAIKQRLEQAGIKTAQNKNSGAKFSTRDSEGNKWQISLANN